MIILLVDMQLSQKVLNSRLSWIRIKTISDYGSVNHRRYVALSKIAAILNEKQPGPTEALLGMHALTGCDFTSCFFRKGKLKPFVTDVSYVMALRSLTWNYWPQPDQNEPVATDVTLRRRKFWVLRRLSNQSGLHAHIPELRQWVITVFREKITLKPVCPPARIAVIGSHVPRPTKDQL